MACETCQKHFTAHTEAAAGGNIELRMHDRDNVEVDMGAPRFEPGDIPLQVEARSASYTLEADGRELTIGAVSMGNPHAVLRVDDTDTVDIHSLGPAIETHPLFPQNCNAGFMQVVAEDEIRPRRAQTRPSRLPAVRRRPHLPLTGALDG